MHLIYLVVPLVTESLDDYVTGVNRELHLQLPFMYVRYNI